tara:strand:- start:215 stop:340 length:126 start_codon:yes stop_codon:yes gene_type:complete
MPDIITSYAFNMELFRAAVFNGPPPIVNSTDIESDNEAVSA